MFLVTTFAAVLLGIFVQAPGIGITLAIISAPAFIRAVSIDRIWRKAGQPLTPVQRLWSFLGSVLVMATIVASTAIAFFGICFPLGAIEFDARGNSSMIVLAFAGGGLAALVVAGFLINALWLKVAYGRKKKLPTARTRVTIFLQTMSVILCIATAVAISCFTIMYLVEEENPQGVPEKGSPTILLATAMLVGAIGGIALVRYWFRAATWVAAMGLGGAICATLGTLANEEGWLPNFGDPLFYGSGIIIVSFLVGMTIGGAIIYRWPIPTSLK